MCRMVETGIRWKREIELPPPEEAARYLAFNYDGQMRYVRTSTCWNDDMLLGWLKPLYAIRVKARDGTKRQDKSLAA